MKKSTYNNVKEFLVNSEGILIKMLQVNSGKIRMNSKLCVCVYIYVQTYTYSCFCIYVGVCSSLWNIKRARRTIQCSDFSCWKELNLFFIKDNFRIILAQQCQENLPNNIKTGFSISRPMENDSNFRWLSNHFPYI